MPVSAVWTVLALGRVGGGREEKEEEGVVEMSV